VELVDAFILAWGLLYPASAIIKPDLIGNLSPNHSRIALLGIGATILTGLALRAHTIGKAILFGMGILEAFGCVSSWVGNTKWNVPFEDKVPFNISMAFLDLISAVAMFAVSLGGK